MPKNVCVLKKKIPRQQWTANSTLRKRNKGDSTIQLEGQHAWTGRRRPPSLLRNAELRHRMWLHNKVISYLFVSNIFFFKHQVHLIPEVTPTVDLVRCFIYNAFFYKHEKKGWPLCNSFSFKFLIRRPDEDRWQTSCVRSYIPMVLTCQ